MTFKVLIPTQRFAPLSWAASVVFRDFLGLDVTIAAHDSDDIQISDHNRYLRVASQFPDLHLDWEGQEPQPPLPRVNLSELGLKAGDTLTELPLLFGQSTLENDEHGLTCGIDIFGTIFFMLSRFEEVQKPELDRFERFSALTSLAYAEHFLMRPIVDEYVEVLWALMKKLWPSLGRTSSAGKIRISCDVDQPFDRVGTNLSSLLRGIGGDVLRRKSVRTATKRFINFLTHRSGNLRYDPFYTFDWYMDVCEQAGHQASFYFIVDHSGGAIDGDYDITSPHILTLMRHIHDRGHEIGMHGSFNTFRDVEQMKRERQRLIEATQAAGLSVQIEGNRQHYLRWDTAITPDILDETGFCYDTTGGFADRPGFRYGTARSFPMWSWQKQAPLGLRQRPLVLMECSIFADNYLGLGYTTDAMRLMKQLRCSSLRYGGDFNILWHNSHFLTACDRGFFCEIIG